MDKVCRAAADKPPTVCILTAGKGSRMGMAFPLNKALLPLGEKAVLSRIVEKFPANSRFVIALGYCGRQVREFLGAAHPELHFDFVEVPEREGERSGPGRSILECAPFLEGPFFFVACDTLWEGDIPLQSDFNWLGIAPVPDSERVSYLNVADRGGLVTALVDKRVPDADTRAFIGLGFIRDPAPFFSGLANSRHEGELQFSHGLEMLLAEGLRALPLSWTDVGSREKYLAAAAQFAGFDFNKDEEFLYLSRERVVKLFCDPQIVANRVARTSLSQGLFPSVEYSGEQLFAYRFIPGATLYEEFSSERITRLLPWLKEHLWIPKERPDFAGRCRAFYLEKTRDRLRLWERKHPSFAEPVLVNGKWRPPLRELLEEFSWERVCQGVPSFFHGDLQPDNILCTKEGFRLIDWRQDFAGSLEAGDLYYDLAKLRGGLVLNYRLVKEGSWSYEEGEEGCRFALPCFPFQEDALSALDGFVEENALDGGRLRLIVGLIFANMAPLHNPHLGKLLWNLSREVIAKELEYGP